MYQNASVIAFDTNFGDSFGSEVEIFAAKTWVPYNAIKIFEYDFHLMGLTELYEIPIEANQLQDVKSVQMVRISEIELVYAVLIDWCSIKSIYILQFQRTPDKKAVIRSHQTYKVSTCLIGKYDVICPSLYESTFVNGSNTNVLVNQQLKMIPNYKSVSGHQRLFRDGFSLLIDQVRFDFDYKYFSNVPNRENIKFTF